MLELLDQGDFVSTYKYALLLSLIDISIESAGTGGDYVELGISTRHIAEKTIENYWPHANTYQKSGRLLVQMKSTKPEHNTILSKIHSFRSLIPAERSASLFFAKNHYKDEYDHLLDFTEERMVEMPIRRLQNFGGHSDAFIYRLEKDDVVSDIGKSRFDRKSARKTHIIFLRPGVAQLFARLSGILRPIIQREWTRKVARFNQLDEYELEDFLFGLDRVTLSRVRPGLVELQEGRCFYCGRHLNSKSTIDHFVPWSRHHDNGLFNLVASDECNSAKSDFLPAAMHVEKWVARAESLKIQIESLGESIGWETDCAKTGRIAASIYHRIPAQTRLWVEKKFFEAFDTTRICNALSKWPT